MKILFYDTKKFCNRLKKTASIYTEGKRGYKCTEKIVEKEKKCLFRTIDMSHFK